MRRSVLCKAWLILAHAGAGDLGRSEGYATGGAREVGALRAADCGCAAAVVRPRSETPPPGRPPKAAAGDPAQPVLLLQAGNTGGRRASARALRVIAQGS